MPRLPKCAKNKRSSHAAEDSDSGLVLNASNAKRSALNVPSARVRHSPSRPHVVAALYALDHCHIDDEEKWLQVGRALWAWARSETNLNLWTSWSTRHGTRSAADCSKAWKQFGQGHRGSSVTIDDLFDWAESCGRSLPQKSSGRVDGPQVGAWGLAEQFLEATFLITEEGRALLTLRFYHGEFYRWRGGRYVAVPVGEIRNAVVRFLGAGGYNVTAMLIAAVLDSIRAQTEVPPEKEAPCWLDEEAELLGEIGELHAAPEDVIATRNGLVDVGAFLDGRHCVLPATPRFFCTSAADFDFNAKGPNPSRWLAFLNELWSHDPASIETLQEWAGYVVMRRTELQKILMVVGPPRAGKGTIAKVLTELAGPASTAAPKLSDFAQTFGLAPLIDRTLAIIPDARIGSRHDEATLVERLLSISGEDTITVDRKYRDPLTGKLGTRIAILTNELPGWADTSGALASRLIVLRLTKSFISPDGSPHDKENQYRASGLADPQLWQKLQCDLPAILRWALQGWKRLRERGYFRQPESGRPLLEQAADLASPIHAFVRDECTAGPDKQVLAQQLYDLWRRYCERTGEIPGTIQSFAKGLRAVVPNLETCREKHDGHTDRWLVGVSPNVARLGGTRGHLAPVSKHETKQACKDGLQPVRRREQEWRAMRPVAPNPARKRTRGREPARDEKKTL